MSIKASSGTISAKAKCMYGKRLTAENYNDMLRKRSVTELATYLKENTYYSDALQHVDTNSIHRGQLENILHRELFNRYTKLCRYNFGDTGEFYDYLVYRLEIQQLLRCIMYLNADTMNQFIIELPAFLIQHADFDLLALAKVRNMEDLLELVEHTPYHQVLEEFVPIGDEPIDYTACEKALMNYHYHHILDVVSKKFKGNTKKDLEKIIKINVTLSNITTMYRLKIFFHADHDTVKNNIYDFNYRMTQNRLNEFLDAENPDEFLEVFKNSYYGKAIDGVEFTYFENYAARIKNQFNKKLMRFSTSPPAVLYAYIALNLIEIDNITSIIEGIRYQVPSSQIQKLLVI